MKERVKPRDYENNERRDYWVSFSQRFLAQNCTREEAATLVYERINTAEVEEQKEDGSLGPIMNASVNKA